MAAENEAHVDRIDEYGVFYRVEGALQGPDGILAVVTIWMRKRQIHFTFFAPAYRQPLVFWEFNGTGAGFP